jgi:hypothetical protein
MPRHFSNQEFLGKRDLYCTSIVLWPANNTQTSAIYKFTSAHPHHTLFHDTQFAHEIFETYNLTFGSSRLLGNYCHPVFNPLCLLCIFRHFLESLSRPQFHTYSTFFTCGFQEKRTTLPVFFDLQIDPLLPRYSN